MDMKQAFFALAIVLLLSAALPAANAYSDADIEISADTSAVCPCSTLTTEDIGVIVTNLGDRTETFELSLDVPSVTSIPNLDVELSVPVSGKVVLELYDCSGRKVRTLIDDPMHPSGMRRFRFQTVDDYGAQLQNGVYFIRLTTQSGKISRKAIYLR